MAVCQNCGRPLTVWDEGFYKKLVNRGAAPVWCIACTAGYFRIPEETALSMIRRFQQTGCTLFPAQGAPELHTEE